MDVWDGIKTLVNWVIVPCFAGLWFFLKKHINRSEILEKRLVDAEKAILVMESQMSDIRKDIDEIKLGINKLVDKICH